MIQVKDVAVQSQHALLWNGINLTFDDGVNYLIKGRNGNGKTTLLKLLSGNMLPKSGSVHYSFVPEHGDWDEKFQLRKQCIHFIPTHALHDLLRGPEFYYQQRYYTIEESDSPQTVRKYLGDRLNNLSAIQFPDSFRIDALLNLELVRLSNGQIKKVIILKQLLDSIPKVLLLDYPFEGLDAESRLELSEFLDHLSTEQGVQLIVADHDDANLLKSVSQIINLDHSPLTIQDRTKTQRVQQEIGSVQPAASHSSAPVVEMRNVTIRYSDKTIIENLNWTIRKGERWALTGRNGSGKTTLFSLIFADHPMAYSEQVFLFGKRRGTGESIWDIKNRIAYLGPEQLHFLDYFTENQTVRMYLKTKEAHVFETLNTFFKISFLLDRKMKQLSNGELQLVLLLSLFLTKKEMLLLDEPFQFLDDERKEQVTEYLKSSLNTDTTLLLITHYEGDVARWTDFRMRL